MMNSDPQSKQIDAPQSQQTDGFPDSVEVLLFQPIKEDGSASMFSPHLFFCVNKPFSTMNNDV